MSEETVSMMKSRGGWLIGVIGIVVLLGMIDLGFRTLDRKASNRQIDQETYQIVTLTSGRSYFGALEGLDREYAMLRDAFYIRASAPEPSESAEEAKEPEETPLALKRVGNEIYQATDDLSIRTDQILSWQNLEVDSPVVSAIDNFLESQTEEKKERRDEKME